MILYVCNKNSVLNGTVRGSVWLCLPVISALQKQDQCKIKVTCETLCHKTRGANTSLNVLFFTKSGFHPSLSMSSLNSHSTLGCMVFKQIVFSKFGP